MEANINKVARVASRKNFVLTDEKGKENYFMMGKETDNLYHVVVAWPFSLYQAFGLAISAVAQ